MMPIVIEKALDRRCRNRSQVRRHRLHKMREIVGVRLDRIGWSRTGTQAGKEEFNRLNGSGHRNDFLGAI
jgi:hypothetical protein